MLTDAHENVIGYTFYQPHAHTITALLIGCKQDKQNHAQDIHPVPLRVCPSGS